MRSELRGFARQPRPRADLLALLVLALVLIGAAGGETPSGDSAGEAEAAQEAAAPDPLAEAEAELLARIDAVHGEIRELEAGLRDARGEDRRGLEVAFHIAHDEDVERVETIFRDVLGKHEKVLADPPFNVAIHHIGQSSVEFIVRPWVATADYWDVYWDVIRAVKRRFDEEGIRMPFPHVHVHPPPAS